MKQKIVINVPMPSDKTKSTAMTIAVTFQGVSSVSLGKDADKLEIVGEGIDSVCLAKSLRKKFCFANILSIEEVKPPKPDDKNKEKEKEKEKCLEKLCHYPTLQCGIPNCPPPCAYPAGYIQYDTAAPGCSIM